MSWASKLSNPYRIDHGRKFRLKDFDPADTGHFHSKEHAQELLDKGIAEMRELHGKLYAQSVGRNSVHASDTPASADREVKLFFGSAALAR